MRLDRERLNDILEAIEKIQQKIDIDRERFFTDEMLQVWIIHYIQIIGEAASRLSPQLKESNPTVQWVDVISMRNVLVHHYFGIDLQQIWDTVMIDLPLLKSQITQIINQLKD